MVMLFNLGLGNQFGRSISGRGRLYMNAKVLFVSKWHKHIYFFHDKVAVQECVTLVVNLFNSCYYAVICRVVHIFTLLHKMLCGSFQFLH